MPSRPSVGGQWIQLAVDALELVGFPARAQVRRLGHDYGQLSAAEYRVPWNVLVQLWRTAARVTGDPYLGMHAAERLPVSAANLSTYVILSSANLYEGFSHLERVQGLILNARSFSIDDRGDHFAIGLHLALRPSATSHQVEYTLTIVKRVCAFVAGLDCRLVAVHFRHRPPAAGAAEHARVFECPVSFLQPENALLVPRAVMYRASPFANSEAFRIMREETERRVTQLEGASWVVRVRAALQPGLPNGRGDLAAIARHLHVTPRTLQRHLLDEGSTFNRILDSTRRDRALELVASGAVTVAEISHQLGFSDVRAFTRAFRRWTALTPSAYRQKSVSRRTGTHRLRAV